MIPIEGWKEEYGNLLESLFSRLTPDRLTLGSIRGLSKTLRFAKGDTSWRNWLKADSGWGLKLSDPLREEMYRFMIETLERQYGYTKVALCKETQEMWEKLGMNPGTYPSWENCTCNCTW